MRQPVRVPTLHEQDVLSEVLELIGCQECREEVGWAFSPSGLRVVRDDLRAAKSKGEDVFSVLRLQAGMVKTQRIDRDRALGNTVVPQQAAFAFSQLLGWIE